jgi:hypothetical protein
MTARAAEMAAILIKLPPVPALASNRRAVMINLPFSPRDYETMSRQAEEAVLHLGRREKRRCEYRKRSDTLKTAPGYQITI